MAPFLTKILMETGQTIPEFFEQYKPEGEINFDEEDPEFEEAAVDNEADGAWGGGGNVAAPVISEAAWGSEDAAAPVAAQAAWDSTDSPSNGAW